MTAGSSLDIERLAVEKATRVLGPQRARQVLDAVLRELGIELRTADDLLLVSRRMSQLGGFEGAVGAMLGVTAVLRGASPPQSGTRR